LPPGVVRVASGLAWKLATTQIEPHALDGAEMLDDAGARANTVCSLWNRATLVGSTIAL